MLVGRRSEQRTVNTLVSAARIGQSAVLVVTGEAGIGKTALLGYALTQTAGMRVLRVTGSESEQHLPFAALAQLLRVTPAELDGLPAPQAQALGVALALRAGDGVDRFAVGAATLTLLTQRSEHQPLAVLIDDAHLIDRPSQQALAFVMRRLLADAVVVLAAARADQPCELVASDLPRLELLGIDLAATHELVLAGQDRAPDQELTLRVAALAEGNPLAIIELINNPTVLMAQWLDAPGEVSAALTRLYAQRAALLEPAERQVLLLAATAGEDLLLVGRACAAMGVGLQLLVAAERLGLITVGPDRVRFAHPLTRSAIYSSASIEERRKLHAVVASVLAPDDSDRRAWHRSEAAFGPDETAAADLALLAGRAVARGAFSVAAIAYERAARLSAEQGRRALRLLDAGTAAWHAGDGSRAQPLLHEALLLAPATLHAVEAQRLLGVIAARSGRVTEARTGLQAGAELARSLGSPGEALTCQVEVINACFYLGDAAGALAAAQQVEVLLADSQTGARAAVATMAAGMGRILAGQGGPSLIRRGVQMLCEAGGSPRQSNDDSSWVVLGPLFLREAGTGRDLVRAAIDDRRDRAVVGTLPHLLFHVARDEATTDQWARAEANYAEATTLAREFGQTTELAMSSAGLAWLMARMGRVDQARGLAADAEQLGREHEVHLARVWARYALGDLALGLGAVELAIDHYVELDELLDELGVLDVDLSPVPELVEALIHAGRRAEATNLVGPFSARAEAKGQPWALARAGRVRGLLCSDDNTDSTFAAALQLHDATLDGFETARTRLAYGARLRRSRRRVDARPQLQQALDTFDTLGAQPWADRAAQELVATGATALRTGSDPSSQLTPRELQIALLLSDGNTVRQAAAALFLSPKTVEYHLRHVYTKLRIGSRTQLAELLRSTAGRV